MIANLCERSISRGDITPHPSISNFMEIFEIYQSEEKHLSNLISESRVSKCNLHELRLLIELIVIAINEDENSIKHLTFSLATIALYMGTAMKKDLAEG